MVDLQRNKAWTFRVIAGAIVTVLWSLPNVANAQSAANGIPEPMPSRLTNVPINAPIPPITIDAGDEQISGIGAAFQTDGSFVFTGGATVVGGTEFTLRADQITGNSLTGIATAEGHVYFRELNTYIDVDSLFASSQALAASAQNIVLRQAPYTIYAQRLSFDKNEIALYSGVLTTTPPGVSSDYSIRAGKIVFQPAQHRLTIYNGSFYIGKKRLFAFKKLSRRLSQSAAGGGGADKLFSESAGYTGYLGPYIDYTSHYGSSDDGLVGTLRLSEMHNFGLLLVDKAPLITPRPSRAPINPKTLLGRIREAVEATEPILPEGDPLLFHWFETQTTMSDRFLTVPNTLSLTGTGVASYKEMVYGHATDTLFYSRLPEASFTAIEPISGPRTLPNTHDPEQVRDAMRQIALYAEVIPTVGRYYEYPDDITSNREQIVCNIQSRPILVGDNLLFKPVLSYQNSIYPTKHDSYKITQIDLALEKYVTDETGYGIEYIDSQEQGASPFQFDTPYASQELDTRYQIGLPRMIIGLALKYNIAANDLYSEQIMIAPRLRSLIPKFTFDLKEDSFSLGFDINGLTY